MRAADGNADRVEAYAHALEKLDDVGFTERLVDQPVGDLANEACVPPSLDSRLAMPLRSVFQGVSSRPVAATMAPGNLACASASIWRSSSSSRPGRWWKITRLFDAGRLAKPHAFLPSGVAIAAVMVELGVGVHAIVNHDVRAVQECEELFVSLGRERARVGDVADRPFRHNPPGSRRSRSDGSAASSGSRCLRAASASRAGESRRRLMSASKYFGVTGK